MIVRISDNR